MRDHRLLPFAFFLLLFQGMALHAGNLYVLSGAGTGAQTVDVLDSDSLTTVTSFEVPANPLALYPNASNTKLYVVSRNPWDAVVVQAAGSSTRIRTIILDDAPTASVMTPDGNCLAVLAGKLHLYDTNNDSEVSPSAGFDVGGPTSLIASDLSSSRILVLDPERRTLSAVDLQSNLPTDSPLLFDSTPAAMAVGPNGLLYVSAAGKVYVVDVRTLRTRAEILLVGTPGRLVFTPDGLRAVAVNQSSAGGRVAFVFDLVAATAKAQVYDSTFPVDHVTVAGNDTAYLASQSKWAAYKLTLNPIALSNATFAAAPSIGYVGLVTSNEVPSPAYIYSWLLPGMVYKYSNASPNIPLRAVVAPSGGSMFFHEVSAGLPASLMRFGDGQTVAAGAISAPLVVQLLDNAGKPVPGSGIVFSTSTPGAAVVARAIESGIQGYALTYVRVPTTTGTVTVTATSSVNPSITTTFTLNVTTGSGGGTDPGTGGSVEIVSGNGQVIEIGRATYSPLRVAVRDASGKPVSGQQVSWRVPSGRGNLTSYGSTTGEDGLAETYFIGVSLSPTQSYDQTSVTAAALQGEAAFVVTTVPDAMNALGLPRYPDLKMLTPEAGVGRISGKLGQVLTGAIRVEVKASWGSLRGVAMPNVGVALTSTADPKSAPVPICVGGTVLSDANGIAICDVVLTGHQGEAPFNVSVGGALGWTLMASAAPGDPGEVNIIQGDKQSGIAGAQLPLQLVGEISDGYGNIMAGAEVTWEIVTPGSLTLGDKVEKADSSGRVFARVTLGNISGSFQVKVRSKVGSAVGVFTVFVNIPVSSLVKSAGDNQSAHVGQDFALPLVALVVDGENKGIQGIAVSFTVVGGSATVTSATVTTGADGKASTHVRAGPSAGAIAVRASITGFSVTFNLAAVLPGPQVAAAGFVNGAGGQPGVVPGGIVTIYGQGIAPNISGSVAANGVVGALPLKLADVEVIFGSTPAPIFNVSNVNGMQSVTVQAPFELGAPGSVNVTVRVGSGSTVVADVPTLAIQPGLFETVSASGSRAAVAIGDNGRYILPGAGARPGEIVRVFVTGLGQPTPASATNEAGVPGQKATADLVVGLNNEGVPLLSAEYMVGVAGIYVVAFQVPASSPSGDLPFVVAAVPAGGGLIYSNPSKLAVQ